MGCLIAIVTLCINMMPYNHPNTAKLIVFQCKKDHFSLTADSLSQPFLAISTSLPSRLVNIFAFSRPLVVKSVYQLYM